jgi:regulatory protein
MPAGTITALRAQARDNQRVNVFIDDAFAIGVGLNTLAREQLYVGKVLDQAAWSRLEAAESADKAFQAALPLLNARPRSIAEVRRRLARKQFPPPSIDAAVEKLCRLDLLDDAAFARYWIDNRNAYRPRGARALRAELAARGVGREIIEAELARSQSDDTEREQAVQLARQVLPRYAGAADRLTFQRRLAGYLQRRGFGYNTIAPIVEQLWIELHPDQA